MVLWNKRSVPRAIRRSFGRFLCTCPRLWEILIKGDATYPQPAGDISYRDVSGREHGFCNSLIIFSELGFSSTFATAGEIEREGGAKAVERSHRSRSKALLLLRRQKRTLAAALQQPIRSLRRNSRSWPRADLRLQRGYGVQSHSYSCFRLRLRDATRATSASR